MCVCVRITFIVFHQFETSPALVDIFIIDTLPTQHGSNHIYLCVFCICSNFNAFYHPHFIMRDIITFISPTRIPWMHSLTRVKKRYNLNAISDNWGLTIKTPKWLFLCIQKAQSNSTKPKIQRCTWLPLHSLECDICIELNNSYCYFLYHMLSGIIS